MNITIEQAKELTETGSLVVGQYQLRFIVEPDHDTNINDFDCYGKVSQFAYDFGSREPRPEGFDGTARKVQVDRGSWVWWQPTDELKSLKAWVEAGESADTYDRAFADHIRLARDLLECGFSQIGVKVYETLVDSRGEEIFTLVEQQWLGGIDSAEGDYLVSLVHDLTNDVLDGFPDVLDGFPAERVGTVTLTMDEMLIIRGAFSHGPGEIVSKMNEALDKLDGKV